MLIAALVAGALACMLLGLVLDEIALAYVALGVSLLGIAVLTAANAWRRRTSPSGHPTANQYGSAGPTCPDGAVAPEQPERVVTEAEAEPPSGISTSDGTEPGIEDPSETHVVHVVPGRRRYHVAACRLLNGYSNESITLEEAHEEGFSACTTCVPHGAQPATNPACP
jgi:hypothetical protein